MAPYKANAQLPWLPRLDPVMGGVSAVISKYNDLIAYDCPAVGTNGSSSQVVHVVKDIANLQLNSDANDADEQELQRLQVKLVKARQWWWHPCRQ